MATSFVFTKYVIAAVVSATHPPIHHLPTHPHMVVVLTVMMMTMIVVMIATTHGQ